MLHDLCSLLFVEREMAWQISQVHSLFPLLESWQSQSNSERHYMTIVKAVVSCHVLKRHSYAHSLQCAFSWSLNCTSIGALHNGFA